ncbi:MAG: BNR repeat-containing protein [Planctomycetia bacterium]|nr:BNR repeat-containing protein [Planctomycetia bacterium]
MKIRWLLCCWLFVSAGFAEEVKPWKIMHREEIAKVWSGNPVGFAFLEKDGQLFAAFYSAEDKSMTVAQKKSPDAAWTFQKLPTKIGWDSHNYIAMAFDADDILHVSGNMHAVPLIYFRAEKPMDITSLRAHHRMLAQDTSKEALQKARENRVTYPQFFRSPDGTMIFTYRDGSSGNGVQIWNQYDRTTKTWKRFLDQPMFDGEGACNAYFQGPARDANGMYHVTWVWRDTPDAATNHDLSYMRSRDLVHWEKSDGTPLTLPVTRATGEVIAPLQNGEGLLNSHVRIGFDTENRVVVTYTRYDANKNNQLMQARLENGVWKTYQTTDWTHSWVFSGGGCLPGELGFGEVRVRNGKLVQYWNRKFEKSGEFELDPATLKPIGPAPKMPATPAACTKCENPQENQRVKTGGMIDSRNPNRRYLFAWETLPVNRDRAHDVVPNPSVLRMFVLEREP